MMVKNVSNAVGQPIAPNPSTAIRPSTPAISKDVAAAAKQFEAMAIGQMLKPMFDTIDTSSSPFSGGPGEQAWRPMLVQEFAKQMAARDGIGLAKPIYDAMIRMQKAKSK